jgi:hypothetical protein
VARTASGHEILVGDEADEDATTAAAAGEARHYRVTLSRQGQHEVATTRGGRDPEPVDESLELELLYRDSPAADASGETLPGRLLVLDALRELRRSRPPPFALETEIANDRLRVNQNRERKPALDLRGAQPKEKLTPRHLLGKPFALLTVEPPPGRVIVSARGAKTARELLKSLQLHEVVGWVQVAVPDGPLEVGATWTAGRFPANPPGELGLEVPIRHIYLGVQTLDGVRCGHLSLDASLDQQRYASAFGFEFDRATAKVRGEAWFELDSRRMRRVVIEDDVRASHSKSVDTATMETRYRYTSRTTLDLIRPPGTLEHWSDGSEVFGVR